AVMTRPACEVKSHVDLPLGINILRNDGEAALTVALASGADYIRINVLTGARVTDQGVINGIAARLLRLRKQLDADRIAIWADVNVKHSQPLGKYSLVDDVTDIIKRGHADALIVSGKSTGSPVDKGELQQVKAIATDRPVLVGSGVNAANAKGIAGQANGLIVGSSLKADANIFSPVDLAKVEQLVQAVNE
ncbi:MAG: membrane complex biogenesis BtpA family protein, partial [Pirellulaceae bacterium]